MLPKIAFDPKALWLFDGSEVDQPVEKCLEKWMSWFSPKVQRRFPLEVSDRALGRLLETNHYPLEPYFKRVLAQCGLTGVVNSKHLASIVLKFISNAKRVEDNTLGEVKDVLFEEGVLIPDVLELITEIEIRLISKDSLFLIIANNKRSREIGHYKYLLPICDLVDDVRKIGADCQVLATVPDFEERSIVGKLSEAVDVIHSLNDYFDSLDPDEEWRKAESSFEIGAAIYAQARRITGRKGNCGFRKFYIGTEFINTLKNHDAFGGKNSSLVLTKCAQIVANVCPTVIHDFRVSEAINANVRKRDRDDAVAKRVHLTERGRALRLMYWEIEPTIIEFSDVRNKSDVTISEGGVLLGDELWDY